jgi:hypothetical protein
LPVRAGTKLREFFRMAFHLLQLSGSNRLFSGLKLIDD